MAMEDANLLADELRLAATVEEGLNNYAVRRKPRVRWVQEQSIATGEGLRSRPASVTPRCVNEENR
jgi:2-polyprenyl-6-methoxyphenol hydroxylase-like FAD-dependent oxidoreductase